MLHVLIMKGGRRLHCGASVAVTAVPFLVLAPRLSQLRAVDVEPLRRALIVVICFHLAERIHVTVAKLGFAQLVHGSVQMAKGYLMAQLFVWLRAAKRAGGRIVGHLACHKMLCFGLLRRRASRSQRRSLALLRRRRLPSCSNMSRLMTNRCCAPRCLTARMLVLVMTALAVHEIPPLYSHLAASIVARDSLALVVGLQLAVQMSSTLVM
jgi:hypothetical protein